MSDVFYATGRRKTSSARVFLKPGTGKIKVNGQDLRTYIFTQSNQSVVMKPFEVTRSMRQYDAYITVRGGGTTGQADAICHGISRALTAANEEYRPTLKKAGLLKRDPRMVERKKYGFRKARRSPQFSKR